MSLHLITGRANSGKTGVINERLLESLACGHTPMLLLPSVADVRRAEHEYAEKAPVGLVVSTLTQWADSLWRLHGDGRRIVAGASREAFVRRAIVEVPSAALASVSGTAGFSAIIVRIVQIMAENAPDPRALESETMSGIDAICRRYRGLLRGAGLVERSEAWRALGAEPVSLEGLVAANRFADLDEPELALLEGLSQRNDVVIALTWEDGFAPTRALDATAERLQARARSVTQVPEAEAEGELVDLIDRLYAGVVGVRSDGAVRVGLAAGSEAEAALVARRVAESVESGIAPERIVVAFPDLGVAAHRLETALTAEGVPCEIDLARPVAVTPLGRSIGALVTLALGSGDRATALGVLLGPHSDVSAETAAAIDREWRRLRVTDPSRLLADMAARIGTHLGQAAETVRDLAHEGVTGANGKKWQNLVHSLVSAAASKSLERGCGNDGELAVELERDVAVARAVVRAIGEMASAEGTPFSASDVLVALSTVVSGGTAGERVGVVQVTEIARLRSRRFDTVVLGGLTEAELPAADPDSLSEELRAVFAPGSATRGEEHARLSFYLAVSRARSGLFLVRKEADDRGAPMRPSVLFEEVVDAYRRPEESDAEWPSEGPLRERLSAADVATAAPVFTRGRRELRKQASEGDCALRSPIRGELHDAGVLNQLAAADVFSATEIEAYLQCPYRWFYERVVRPEEIDVEVDARAVGTIAHALLTAFYDALPAALGAQRVTLENLPDAQRLLQRIVVERHVDAMANGLAEELAIERAVRWVRTAVSDDVTVLPGFTPANHEFAFGESGGGDIVVGGAKFKGRIDRIDRSEDAVFVTDYKSSRVVPGHERFAKEGKVQAVVYALAAGEAFGLPVAGSVYRSLRSRQMRGFWRADLVGGALAFGDECDSIGRESFDALVGEAEARVEVAVAGIRAGRVPREPSDGSTCRFCALRALCGGASR